jgi:glycosyltransferase involved in cell wall biosynthesis
MYAHTINTQLKFFKINIYNVTSEMTTLVKKIYRAFLKKYYPYVYAKKYNAQITIKSKHKNSKLALLSYILEPFKNIRATSSPSKHSNYGNAWEVIRVLNSLGFDVDIIEASQEFDIIEPYDLVIGTLDCIDRFKPFLPEKTTFIFYALGAYVDTRNGPQGELLRIKNLEKRTQKNYFPKRLFKNAESIRRSVEKADGVIITGGNATIESFPRHILTKSEICTMPIFPETIPLASKMHKDNIGKEYLWFFGYGQVHKGLDLVIEAFLKMPQYNLNIVGTMETDFYLIYGDKINQSKNIYYYGFLDTKGPQFLEIIQKSFCFIAPSVNEGISCAGAILLQLGLYPIISYETGLDLPDNAGIVLKESSIDEIRAEVEKVSNLTTDELYRQTSILKNYSKEKYSPEAFNYDFTKAVKNIIKNKKN